MLLHPLTIGPSDFSGTFGVPGSTGILRARGLQDHWATLGPLHKRTLGTLIGQHANQLDTAWVFWKSPMRHDAGIVYVCLVFF